jgi:diaminopimelate epimerase
MDKSALARVLCSRRLGIGADGLIVLEPSIQAQFTMLYYNADGTYGGMCGNGGRCAARFAYIHGIAEKDMTFDALDHLYRAEIIDDRVRLFMKNPGEITRDIAVRVDESNVLGHFVDTGSPHFVSRVDHLDSFDVVSVGRAIRNHKIFRPHGTNVDFIHVLQQDLIEMRTYERGVEDETLACGTGAVASAIITSEMHHTVPPVRVRVRSGEELVVGFEKQGSEYTYVTLEGSAYILFAGKVLYDSSKNTIADIFPHQKTQVKTH